MSFIYDVYSMDQDDRYSVDLSNQLSEAVLTFDVTRTDKVSFDREGNTLVLVQAEVYSPEYVNDELLVVVDSDKNAVDMIHLPQNGNLEYLNTAATGKAFFLNTDSGEVVSLDYSATGFESSFEVVLTQAELNSLTPTISGAEDTFPTYIGATADGTGYLIAFAAEASGHTLDTVSVIELSSDGSTRSVMFNPGGELTEGIYQDADGNTFARITGEINSGWIVDESYQLNFMDESAAEIYPSAYWEARWDHLAPDSIATLQLPDGSIQVIDYRAAVDGYETEVLNVIYNAEDGSALIILDHFSDVDIDPIGYETWHLFSADGAGGYIEQVISRQGQPLLRSVDFGAEGSAGGSSFYLQDLSGEGVSVFEYSFTKDGVVADDSATELFSITPNELYPNPPEGFITGIESMSLIDGNWAIATFAFNPSTDEDAATNYVNVVDGDTGQAGVPVSIAGEINQLMVSPFNPDQIVYLEISDQYELTQWNIATGEVREVSWEFRDILFGGVEDSLNVNFGGQEYDLSSLGAFSYSTLEWGNDGSRLILLDKVPSVDEELASNFSQSLILLDSSGQAVAWPSGEMQLEFYGYVHDAQIMEELYWVTSNTEGTVDFWKAEVVDGALANLDVALAGVDIEPQQHFAIEQISDTRVILSARGPQDEWGQVRETWLINLDTAEVLDHSFAEDTMDGGFIVQDPSNPDHWFIQDWDRTPTLDNQNSIVELLGNEDLLDFSGIPDELGMPDWIRVQYTSYGVVASVQLPESGKTAIVVMGPENTLVGTSIFETPTGGDVEGFQAFDGYIYAFLGGYSELTVYRIDSEAFADDPTQQWEVTDSAYALDQYNQLQPAWTINYLNGSHFEIEGSVEGYFIKAYNAETGDTFETDLDLGGKYWDLNGRFEPGSFLLRHWEQTDNGGVVSGVKEVSFDADTQTFQVTDLLTDFVWSTVTDQLPATTDTNEPLIYSLRPVEVGDDGSVIMSIRSATDEDFYDKQNHVYVASIASDGSVNWITESMVGSHYGSLSDYDLVPRDYDGSLYIQLKDLSDGSPVYYNISGDGSTVNSISEEAFNTANSQYPDSPWDTGFQYTVMPIGDGLEYVVSSQDSRLFDIGVRNEAGDTIYSGSFDGAGYEWYVREGWEPGSFMLIRELHGFDYMYAKEVIFDPNTGTFEIEDQLNDVAISSITGSLPSTEGESPIYYTAKLVEAGENDSVILMRGFTDPTFETGKLNESYTLVVDKTGQVVMTSEPMGATFSGSLTNFDMVPRLDDGTMYFQMEDKDSGNTEYFLVGAGGDVWGGGSHLFSAAQEQYAAVHDGAVIERYQADGTSFQMEINNGVYTIRYFDQSGSETSQTTLDLGSDSWRLGSNWEHDSVWLTRYSEDLDTGWQYDAKALSLDDQGNLVVTDAYTGLSHDAMIAFLPQTSEDGSALYYAPKLVDTDDSGAVLLMRGFKSHEFAYGKENSMHVVQLNSDGSIAWTAELSGTFSGSLSNFDAIPREFDGNLYLMNQDKSSDAFNYYQVDGAGAVTAISVQQFDDALSAYNSTAPFGADDQFFVRAGADNLPIEVFQNDGDVVDSTAILFDEDESDGISFTTAQGGEVELVAKDLDNDGQNETWDVEYTAPMADFTGTDTFYYTVQNAVGEVSDPIRVDIEVVPVHQAVDDYANMFQDGGDRIVDILVNDYQGTDWLLEDTLAITQQPSNGTAHINAEGKLVYTPNAGFVGQDTVVYSISDQVDDAHSTSSATVTIDVESSELPLSADIGGVTIDFSGLDSVLQADGAMIDGPYWGPGDGAMFILETITFNEGSTPTFRETLFVFNEADLEELPSGLTVTPDESAFSIVELNDNAHMIKDIDYGTLLLIEENPLNSDELKVGVMAFDGLNGISTDVALPMGEALLSKTAMYSSPTIPIGVTDAEVFFETADGNMNYAFVLMGVGSMQTFEETGEFALNTTGLAIVDRTDGSVLHSQEVQGVPLDVKVDENGQLFIRTLDQDSQTERYFSVAVADAIDSDATVISVTETEFNNAQLEDNAPREDSGLVDDETLKATFDEGNLNGYQGDDKLFGDGLHNTLNGGDGNDLLIGGEGYDTAQFSGNADDYVITMMSDFQVDLYNRLLSFEGEQFSDTGGVLTVMQSPADGSDGVDIVQVEELQFADRTYTVEDGVLMLSDLSDQFQGGNGADIVSGEGGSSNSIAGGRGNDALFANGGSINNLSGQEGDDVLTSLAGAQNNLQGGSGNDYFLVDQNDGGDVLISGDSDADITGFVDLMGDGINVDVTIAGFEVGLDKIDLSALGIDYQQLTADNVMVNDSSNMAEFDLGALGVSGIDGSLTVLFDSGVLSESDFMFAGDSGSGVASVTPPELEDLYSGGATPA